MTFHPSFPYDPHEILSPDIRWVPGDTDIQEAGGRDKLIPPLVNKIRVGVKAWREQNYAGASETTRALLTHWFQTKHWVGDITEPHLFKWYFAQQEAVESAIWLYEIMRCKDSSALLQFDGSGLLTSQRFPEAWPRYVMKMATGSGKTKVISLLLTWCYFHRCYEKESRLSKNFLLLAPNIIVLDRLKVDFEGLRIFHEDPLIPANGYYGRDWKNDFQPSVHIQDEVGNISPFGNIYLTNVHRLFLSNNQASSAEDQDSSSYFLGAEPARKTIDSKLDLGILIRQVADLVIFNDEAHHIYPNSKAWQAIKEIHEGLTKRSHYLSAQFDVTATPKDANGGIFVNTISDYPLCEAIRQGVVKQPVIPDEASMAKLQERTSDDFVERYMDYLRLGYVEWRKVYEVLEPHGKKAVWFIMTDETQSCNQVKDYLEATFSELAGAVLVIHTKRDGSLDENDKVNLDELRKASRNIDSWQSPYKVIVSVMMLKEGWDVQNVTTIVGLRSYVSKILPEQTLGRGLRRMFRGRPIEEEAKLSVIGTEAFIEFVRSIKTEGVDLEDRPMGVNTPPKAPMLIQVDDEKVKNATLDITLPILAPRMHRDWKNLEELDLQQVSFEVVSVKQFSEQEQRKIIFLDIITEEICFTTDMPNVVTDSNRALRFFTRTIMRDLRLVGGGDILYGKLKIFIHSFLFGEKVDLNDLNILRNLSEPFVRRLIVENFKQAINQLTVSDRGITEIKNTIQLSKTRPFLVKEADFMVPKKSLFSQIVGDSQLELDFAKFLDKCGDIQAFAKNNQAMGFYIDYRTDEGSIANYYPDFIIKRSESEIWIVELKGREDLDVAHKRQRLEQYCEDATEQEHGKRIFKSLYIKQEDWERYDARNFQDLINLYQQAT